MTFQENRLNSAVGIRAEAVTDHGIEEAARKAVEALVAADAQSLDPAARRGRRRTMRHLRSLMWILAIILWPKLVLGSALVVGIALAALYLALGSAGVARVLMRLHGALKVRNPRLARIAYIATGRFVRRVLTVRNAALGRG